MEEEPKMEKRRKEAERFSNMAEGKVRGLNVRVRRATLTER